MDNFTPWICCQLGAREHYAIARALHQDQQLHSLITDAWVQQDSLLKYLPIASLKGLTERYHTALKNALISSFTRDLILFEMKERFAKTAPWSRMISRNNWYQRKVIRRLENIAQKYPQQKFTLFTYSYAALEILKYAKSQGWTTILGQIDPGEEEEKIVLSEFNRYPDLAPDWQAVPSNYWQHWRAECALSDYILVNSDWSKNLLIKGGIESTKIQTVPLVYQPPSAATGFQRTYPEKFTQERPLRVLFLGLITLRKGIAACLEAIAPLEGQPIEFWFVGAQQINIPKQYKDHPQIKWIGTVPRSETAKYYQDADVFLFPTLSDGFGLTQLEAQAWKLPIIASKYCGEVVRHNIDGIILEQVNGEQIWRSLLELQDQPERLQKLAAGIQLKPQFSLDSLSQSLQHTFLKTTTST